MPNFNKDITKVTPSDLVNDTNANAAPCELQENVEYILNFLNGNKALLSGVFGNLWDYNQDGKRILYNGGRFDTFAKCNTWDALDQLRVENENEIIFDEANERCVYVGQSGTITNREKWIEREVWIPEVLRDQNVYFSMKAAGSSESIGWTEENSEFETIAIQVLGAEEDVQEFRTVGTWEAQPWYANESYGDPMTTIHIPFRVAKSTTSVKIKIFRTRNSGFLHIDKVYVGGIAAPYDNEIEQYELDRLDINELYDYENAVTKVISTAVMGHKVPDKIENIRGSDLMTYEMMLQFLQMWIVNSATCNLTNIQGTYQIPSTATSNLFTISHENIDGEDTPIVTLVVPEDENDEPMALAREFVVIATGVTGPSGTTIDYDDSLCYTFDDILKSVTNPGECDSEDANSLITVVTSGSSGVPTSGTSGTSGAFYAFETGFYRDIVDQTTKKALKVIGVANVQEGSFDVVLSEAPSADGYAINWSVDTKILCCGNPPASGTPCPTGTGSSGTSGMPQLGNYFHPEAALNNLMVPATNIPDPEIFVGLFGFES